MATVTAPTATTAAQAAVVPPAYNGLWHGKKIPIIGVAGGTNAGKTLFILTADPNTRIPTAPKTTCVWDLEGSSEAYEDGLNFERRDLTAMVPPGYRKSLLYTKWREDLHTIPILPVPKYRLLAVDTFTDVLDGMIEWLRMHPEHFGRTMAQYTNASSMFLWPDVKALLKQVFISEVRPRCETFIFSVHMKNEWMGNQKTGARIPEGLDMMEKVASLYLILDRTPPAKGKDAPRLPIAEVKKQRMVIFGQDAEHDQPILPPRIAECTPDAIRQYILNPPNYANLKPAERAEDHSMTKEEELRLQASMEADRRETAQAELSKLEIMSRRATGTVATVTTTIAHGEPKATDEQFGQIKNLVGQLKVTNEQVVAMLASFGVAKVLDLTAVQAGTMIEKLQDAVKRRATANGEPATAAATQANGAAVGNQTTVPLETPQSEATSADAGDPIGPDQIELLRNQFRSSGTPQDQAVAILKKHGVSKLAELKCGQFQAVLDDIRGTEGANFFDQSLQGKTS